MKIRLTVFTASFVVMSVAGIITSCGTNIKGDGTPLSFTVGGVVSGLSGTLVLQNNSGDDLTLTSAGDFTFSSPLPDNSDYAITVKTQPSGSTCLISNGAGTIAGSNVTNVTVTCSKKTYTIGGAITGLDGSLVLKNNDTDDLTITKDGPFTFPTALAEGDSYNVTASTQPVNAVCTVAGGTGTITNANVTNVTISCLISTTANSYSVSVTTTNLSGTVVLYNNGGDELSITSNGTSTFATLLTDGSTYAVTVASQPVGQTCSVSDNTGTIAGANVTNVAVICSVDAHTVGGTVSGLSGTVVLQNNGGDNLSLTSSGSFTFSTPVAYSATYAVTVLTQPTGQTCSVTNGSGTVAGVNITNVSITCSTDSYTVGGTVGGLSGTVVLQNNGGDNLSLTSSGSFTFSTPVAYSATYAVTVLTQPTGQTCSVTNGSGTVAGVNITNVSITCSTNSYTVGGTVSGLSGTVVLQNNGGNNLSISSSGGFTFSTSIAHGSTYAVTILTQPAGQTCSVTNGSGTIAGANVTNVSVACPRVIIMFGTNATNGNLGGRSGADTLCSNKASSLSLTCSSVHAFIGVSAADEVRDMPTNYSVPTDGIIKSRTGTTIQTSWANLLSGTILTSLYSAGVLPEGATFWWSGSDSSGAFNATNNCSGWTSSDSGIIGYSGYYNQTGVAWIAAGVPNCNQSHYAVCLCY